MRCSLTLSKALWPMMVSLLCPAVALGQVSLQTAPAASAQVKTFTVPEGTRIPLTLKKEISTATAQPGDPVYCMSDFPVVREGAIVIPAGTYVRGVIDSVKRPGKMKGRAEIQLHFNELILPNGVEISLDAPVNKSPEGTVNNEGTVRQSSQTLHDVKKVEGTTLTGASLGSTAGAVAGNYRLGSGIGAGAGAATGILSALLSKGKDLVFSQGSSMEMIFARPVTIQASQLSGMSSSTGTTSDAK
jgi:hypothetical protein